MTNITILNDHFKWIEEHPETFVEAIKLGLIDGISCEDDELHYSATRAAASHYVTVHKSHHADTPQVIVSHKNSAYNVHDEVTNGLCEERLKNMTPAQRKIYLAACRELLETLEWHTEMLTVKLKMIQKLMIQKLSEEMT